MQQATVNLFADMGVQPATLQTGLFAPRLRLTMFLPLRQSHRRCKARRYSTFSVVTIQGTASDVGGVVAGVEVSTDGGTTWHRATGRVLLDLQLERFLGNRQYPKPRS